MTECSAFPALTPFRTITYFHDHVPLDAKRGMRGYVLRMLLDMIRLKGSEMGTCFPSVATLAHQAGRSVRHIRRTLAELEALGIIRREPRRRKDGGYGSNIYRLTGLIEWANKNVRGVSDKDGRITSYRKNKNPRRGGYSMFFKNKDRKKQPSDTAASALVSSTCKAEMPSPDLSERPWRQFMTGQLEFAYSDVPTRAQDAGEAEAARRGIKPNGFEGKAFVVWWYRKSQRMDAKRCHQTEGSPATSFLADERR